MQFFESAEEVDVGFIESIAFKDDEARFSEELADLESFEDILGLKAHIENDSLRFSIVDVYSLLAEYTILKFLFFIDLRDYAIEQ